MDDHVKEFYHESDENLPRRNFHKVIAINDNPKITWEHVVKLIPQICKGWYELSHLNAKDRIQFVEDFWMSKLPYHPNFNPFIGKFFRSLDDIGVYLVQPKINDPYECHLIYSLKDNRGFFKGNHFATEEKINHLKVQFPQFNLPEDYIGFLQIHDGFSKATDLTGIIPSSQLPSAYQNFQELILEEGGITSNDGIEVDPTTLLPFYASFGMPFYQCFWSEWYPEQEMGNVYYSDSSKTISGIRDVDPTLNMSFPTFLDWLMFYLEEIE
jgi:hypothetical protein